jgi:hypothetical protein
VKQLKFNLRGFGCETIVHKLPGLQGSGQQNLILDGKKIHLKRLAQKGCEPLLKSVLISTGL